MTPPVPRRAWQNRVHLIWCLLPIAFLFWVYSDGLKAWFIGDDFAWLGLNRQVSDARDLLRALFAPAAQGTIRPWSERGFFMLFESLFGLDNLPFRLMAFATMTANLVLLASITRRITGSRVAGAIAGLVWVANPALMTVMAWSSAFNQILCAFFLLAAMALFIRYAETGKRLFWWLQLVVFVLGFGALELNVVYPALAAAYTLFIARPADRRKLLLGLTPLFAISVVYFLVHRAVAPLPTSGTYALQWDSRIFSTLWHYGKWTLIPEDWEAFGHSHRRGLLCLGIEIVALGILFALELRKRRSAALFFVAWFFIGLAPFLGLPDHLSDYYLTIPLIGFGMLSGWGFSCAWRGETGGRLWQAGAVIPVIAYLAVMTPVARSATHWWLEKTRPVRAVVLGVEAARAAHPGKSILLNGITRELYGNSVGQGAFIPLGIHDVYLTPESRGTLPSATDLADLDITVLDPVATIHALTRDQVVVYSIAGDHLRNITEAYGRTAPSLPTNRLPGRADVGNPLYSWLLGPSWLPPLAGVRWMPGEATIRLKGPDSGNKLALDGYCPIEQLRRAPRRLAVTVDGVAVGETQINDPESSFHRLFAIPDSLAGRNAVEIGIRVEPVERRAGQDYGLVFGKIEFKR